MLKIFDDIAASESLYTKIVSPVCHKYGLTYMEFTVLMFLANNPDCDTATEIVKRRHLTKSHVSISVSSLQSRGLLAGEYQGANRRTVHLKICGTASPIISDGRAAQLKYFSIMFENFSEEEKAVFKGLAQRITGNISSYLNNQKQKDADK